ncbi:MAG TPA: inosine/guanosine kinase [Myxococcota bacterium]|nr:inosine/guanosine kinase [Myxococcota bacterium]HRY96293.1 inosine/guanosine kinase [Myxococcota bacterium]HSA22351.1 inosine/guanosine kinase [Myxococcota bacterium]
MRFPGNRIAKHYFPVTRKHSRTPVAAEAVERRWYAVGLDQLVMDVEVEGAEALARELALAPGESALLSDSQHRRLMERLAGDRVTHRMSPGGAVGNTINNFTFLSGEPAVLLGALDACIRPGSPAFHYVARTPMAVDLSHVVAAEGTLATAVTFIGPAGDRSFAVAPGISNEFPPEAIPAEVVENAAAVLTTLYCLRDPAWPIARAAERMMALAHAAHVPVALGLGTASLVRERRELAISLLERYVTVAAMNAAEAEALTGVDDALLACQRVLDWVDVVIVTEGPHGLTIGGWVDEAYRRETDQGVRSKSIAEYNRWEYSRLMRRADCPKPLKIYSHIHPYRGGPERMGNTNGAGDAALAALLHDVTANRYHRATVPESDKHAAPVPFLTYSSLSRCAQYGNRVAYEVLRGHSPRLEAPVGPDEEG